MRSLAIAAGCYASGQTAAWRLAAGQGTVVDTRAYVCGHEGTIRGVKFRPGARLDPGQVQDRRGMGGGRGIAVGGGVGTLLVVVVLALLGVDVTGGGSGGSPDPFSLGTGSDSAAPATELSAACRTGADANQRDDCRIVGVVNSVQAYWGDRVQGYREAPTQFFSGQTQTGVRPGDVGGRAVLLPGRPDRLHRPRLLPRAAHALRRARRRVRRGLRHRPRVRPPRPAPARHRPAGRAENARGATSGSVRLELQADCYAGVWAAHAVDTGFVEDLTAADIADGLDAAAAVGDDRIQQRATGRVDRESWTHGSSAQRQRWFRTGYQRRRPGRVRHVRRRRPLTGRAARRPPVRRTIPRPPRV